MMMMNIEENKKRNQDKLKFFLDEKIKIHILKYDKEWLNGILIEEEKPGVFVLKEDVKGLIHVFVSDVDDVDEFREVRK